MSQKLSQAGISGPMELVDDRDIEYEFSERVYAALAEDIINGSDSVPGLSNSSKRFVAEYRERSNFMRNHAVLRGLSS